LDEDRVTVIVTGKNAQDSLGRCLLSIKNLAYRGQVEIIFVDGGSSDHTLDVAKSFQDVQVFVDTSGTPAGGRNLGLRAARGSICAFTDADCQVAPQWLEKAQERLADENVGGVGGPLLPVAIDTFAGRLVYYGQSSLLGSAGSIQARFYPEVRDARSISTSNGVFRRDVLARVGGFDESLRYCEDYDLTVRVRGAGYRTVYDPSVVVFHEYDRTFTSLVFRMFRYGLGRASAMRKKRTTVFLPSISGFGSCVVLLLLSALAATGHLPTLVPLSLLILYAAVVAAQSFVVAIRKRDPTLLLVWITIVLGHTSYILGMFAGLIHPYTTLVRVRQ